jgi:hypothetical protein
MTDIIKQILEAPVRVLRKLKESYKSALTELVIDHEIRIRTLNDKISKLEREYTNRKRKE